jgi:hypothetical protein
MNPQRKRNNTLRYVAIVIAILVVLAVASNKAPSSNGEQNSKESLPSSAMPNGVEPNELERIFNLQTEKAMHDCAAAKSSENCETGEDLAPFRRRLDMFLVDGKQVYLNPDDDGFRSLPPYGADGQRIRASILADLGDYSQAAIIAVQTHIMPTDFLMNLYPSWTIPKLFYENKWSAIDDKQWCGDGCWMVWCEIKPDKPQNTIGPIAGYWEVNLNTNTIKVVDGSATARFFRIKN